MIHRISIFAASLCFIPCLSHGETLKQSPEQIKRQQDSVAYKNYIPKNYNLFEAVQGDLNKDGQKDLVLIVKATDPKAWVEDEYRGKLDRNRRGIIVLFNQKGQYKKIIQNLDLFASENEDGGVYFAPELFPSIEKGRLGIHYGHGRYGYWTYSFRPEGNDMRLVGYDSSSNFGPYVDYTTSINFLTGKKRIQKNMNRDDGEDDAARFKETWSDVNFKPIYLSSIEDIDTLMVE